MPAAGATAALDPDLASDVERDRTCGEESIVPARCIRGRLVPTGTGAPRSAGESEGKSGGEIIPDLTDPAVGVRIAEGASERSLLTRGIVTSIPNTVPGSSGSSSGPSTLKDPTSSGVGTLAGNFILGKLISDIAEGAAHAAGRPNGLMGKRTCDVETVRWTEGDDAFHCGVALLGDFIRVTGVPTPNIDSSRNNKPWFVDFRSSSTSLVEPTDSDPSSSFVRSTDTFLLFGPLPLARLRRGDRLVADRECGI